MVDLAFLFDGAVAVGSKLDDRHDLIAGHFSAGEEGFASVQCPALWVTLLETRDHLHAWLPILAQESLWNGQKSRKRLKEEVR